MLQHELRFTNWRVRKEIENCDEQTEAKYEHAFPAGIERESRQTNVCIIHSFLKHIVEKQEKAYILTILLNHNIRYV